MPPWRSEIARKEFINEKKKEVNGKPLIMTIEEMESNAFQAAKTKKEYIRKVDAYISQSEEMDYKFSEKKYKKPELQKNTLSENLMGILEEGFMSDVSFRVENQTFPAHKTILAARSLVFRAMFTADMKEKNESIVDIPDVDADTFQRLLAYIYTDSIEAEMKWNSASKLYCVADKYALELLKQKCSQQLRSGLHVSSVLDALELGDLHQDGDLKAAAVDFIARHREEIIPSSIERHLEQIIPSPPSPWRRFEMAHPELALDTYLKVFH